MRFQKQLFRHDPDNGIFGDCQRTVLAILLGIDANEVPHVHGHLPDGEQLAMHDNWLRERGVVRIEIPFTVGDPDQMLMIAEHYSQGMPYMLAGMSRLGTNHVVIGQGRKIIWDPSQLNSGIVGPGTDGHYWLGWLFRPLLPAGEVEILPEVRAEA